MNFKKKIEKNISVKRFAISHFERKRNEKDECIKEASKLTA